jgi:hypothetical protein
MRAIKTERALFCSALACFLVALACQAWAAGDDFLPLDSLLGKFEGTIQVENAKPVGHAYQTEITLVDRPANTVSLTATCLDCGTKQWTRTGCGISEARKSIKFVCKGPKNDEAYTFDGKGLNATGFGNKYPYSIHVTKL